MPHSFRQCARALVALATVLLVPSAAARADLILTVNFSGDPTYQSAFDQAADTWESLLGGWQDGFVVGRSAGSSYQEGDTLTELFIDATVEFIDGAGGVLGSAGPTAIIVDSLGFTLATDGVMQFDSADVDNLFNNGTLDEVILHEMAHVMGFGTLWANNNVYSSGTGEFLGTEAALAWQSEFGQSGTPDVELEGGGGTANGHWNEVFGGSSLTGITDGEGRDMRDELMTGWLNPNPFISDMTVASFVDIGFIRPAAIPEPSSALLLGLVALTGAGWRKRQSLAPPTRA